MRYRQQFILIGILLAMFIGMPFAGIPIQAAPYNSQWDTHPVVAQGAQVHSLPRDTPTPFMHRPYYGSRTIAQRTVSFVDHDRPWYDNDGVFVRYDGAKWTNVSIGSCIGGVNCYDGHNGYDLNLRYEPVLSVAAGTVIRAGWYNPLNHASALGLWAAVDHGNGFVTAYGHLSALTVSNGAQIGTQWQVGTSGTTGSSTGPHLHMATYYLPNWSATDPFGWTGNYADPNVVPDNYLWVTDPGTNYPVPILTGNGGAVYPGATLVDDGGAGWSSTGNWNTATSSTDIKGDLHWVTTSSGAATATATWQPTLPADGYYEVGVFVDDNHASSGWAPYTIYSADSNHPGTEVKHTVYVDQEHIGSFPGPYGWENTGPQWISLGTYYFDASMNSRVVLSNATGESGMQLAADGAEFAPVSVSSPVPAPVYRFAVSSDDAPSAMLPSSTTTVHLTVTNTSNFTWGASGTNDVQLIYRWLDAKNSVVATSNPFALSQNVNAGSSLNLTVQVQTPAQAGSYTLQWDMVQGTTVFSKQGAQTHNDAVLVARYAEVFTSPSLPTTLTPGASVNVTVNVQNKGALPWSASGDAQVTLGYHWLDNAGKPVDPSIAGLNSSGTLSADVPLGGSASIPIVLHTPVLAGSYTLVFDMQQQGTWFASLGATPLTLPMTITPTLPKVYYFAEGYTGTGTTEQLSLTDPAATQANITITYLYQNAAPQTRTYQVAAQTERVLSINQEAGANQAVSMIVQSDTPFVAERTMLTQAGAFVAASDSIGSSVLSTRWYFAEGNTTYGWATLLAVMNPSSQAVTMQVTYLPDTVTRFTPPRVSSYTIPARSRATIVLNRDVPNSRFGMLISASSSILVERPEYLVNSPFRGGSSVVGATSAQTTWYFGAGNTSAGINERLVLANPATSSTNAQIRYLTIDGHVLTQSVVVPAQSRLEVNVNNVVQQALHSSVITSSAPIIAERQDFFTSGLRGSTTSMGSSSAHMSWYLAQGDTSNGHTESLALANPSNVATQVQVVYYLPSGKGAPIIKSYTLAANSRLTIDIGHDVGANQLVGTAVYATVPIVVEQVMMFNVSGASGGYASMGFGV